MQEPSFSASRDDDPGPVLPDSENATASVEQHAGPASTGAQAHASGRPSVGQRLAAAREGQQLSVREAAERLHVVPRYVSAIETGQYATLPGVVFLKGYVRAYSRVVGLDEGALANDLEEELRQRDDVFDHAAQPLPFEPAVKNYSSAVLAGIFAVALVSLGVYIWSGDDTVPVDPVKAALGSDSAAVEAARSTDDTVASEAVAKPQVQAEAKPEAKAQVKAEARATASPDNATTVQAEQPAKAVAQPQTGREMASGTANEPAGKPVDAPAAEPAESQQEEFGAVRRGLYSPSEAPVVTDATVEAASPATATVVAKAGQPIGGSGAEINVVFTGDCWFDIRAGNDERTVGLYRAGQSISFSGPFPIEVVVGAVGVTLMTVDGQSLDFSRYPVRNNRVEFTINSQTRL